MCTNKKKYAYQKFWKYEVYAFVPFRLISADAQTPLIEYNFLNLFDGFVSYRGELLSHLCCWSFDTVQSRFLPSAYPTFSTLPACDILLEKENWSQTLCSIDFSEAKFSEHIKKWLVRKVITHTPWDWLYPKLTKCLINNCQQYQPENNYFKIISCSIHLNEKFWVLFETNLCFF